MVALVGIMCTLPGESICALLQFPIMDSKVMMTALIEKVAKKVRNCVTVILCIHIS